jgi:ketosteroid isomerase-like protein
MATHDKLRRWIAGVTMVLAGVGSCAAKPHRHHATREAVLQLEEQWRQAELSDNVAALDRMLSDDYLGVSPFGELSTKAQTLRRMQDRSIVFKTIELANEKVKLVGAIAIVTSRAHVEATRNGRDSAGDYLYTRVYQRLPSGVWKITSFEATRVPTPHAVETPSRSPDAGDAAQSKPQP